MELSWTGRTTTETRHFIQPFFTTLNWSLLNALWFLGQRQRRLNKSGESPLSLVEKSMASKRRSDLLAVLSLGAGTTVHAQPNNPQISGVREQLRKEMRAQGKLDEDEQQQQQQPSSTVIHDPPPSPRRRRKRENVLCLDGGGMRGYQNKDD